MEGVLIKSENLDSKGYGFILDEEMNERFFYISDVNESSISGLKNYSKTLWYDRKSDLDITYILDFDPHNNSKGFAAKNIVLTDKIINDPQNKEVFNAKITAFYRYDVGFSNLQQGVKGGATPKGAIGGGNGSFITGYPEKYSIIILEFVKINGIGIGSIDIELEILRDLNNRKNITQEFMNKLRDAIIDKHIKVKLKGHSKTERLITSNNVFNNLYHSSISEHRKYLGSEETIWELLDMNGILKL
jgi:cold shock CspA family protein